MIKTKEQFDTFCQLLQCSASLDILKQFEAYIPEDDCPEEVWDVYIEEIRDAIATITRRYFEQLGGNQ